ncbi:MAG: YraN family protein [Clostridia bacterium]|nr:YraN family protein [Clostridia bacterium]
MKKLKNLYKGSGAETLAINFLKKNKFKILERNFRAVTGEIDIIALKNDVYHIIEVKSSDNLNFGYPKERVTKDKIWKIKNTTQCYFLKNKKIIDDYYLSFDIIEIIGDKLEFFENAF